MKLGQIGIWYRISFKEYGVIYHEKQYLKCKEVMVKADEEY
jgi:hypothetical protein